MFHFMFEYISTKIRLEEAKKYVKQVQSTKCVCIKSLKHPDVPARLCHLKSTNHPFTCKTCEVTIAHEEQCVHSIVANDMLYIKEQFDLRHFRRDYVSSDYRKKYKKVQENLLHSNINKNISGETFNLDEDSFDT